MFSIGELFIELNVRADNQAVNRFNFGFKDLRKNALLAAGAFTGAVVGLDRLIASTLRGVVSLQNLNNQTGLSIEKLQQFQQAGQLSNLALSADQIAQSIGNVQKNLADIKIGQGNIAPFQLLGINVDGADAFDVIEQIRDSIKGIDPAIATNLISQLGLTPDFINILKLSRKEFELLGENTFLNPQQRADIDNVGTSIKALTLRFKALKDQAIAKIAPDLNELMQKFFKWLKDNDDSVINTIAFITKGFTSFARALGNAFDLSSRFLNNIIGMENGLKILATSFGFLTLSFSPFLAGLAAVILLLDDIAVYRRGGNSITGELFKSFNNLPNIAKIFGGGAGLLVIASSLGAITKSIISMTAPAIALAAPLTAIVTALAFLASSPKIGEFIAEKLDQTSFGREGGDILLRARDSGFLSGVRELFDINKDIITSSVSNVSKYFNNDTASTTVNNNITINGIQDPVAVGAEVRRVTTSQEENNRIFTGQGRGVK